MPELPEVRTVVKDLRPKLIGFKFVDVIVLKEKMLSNSSLEEFKLFLNNEKILNIKNIGKHIIFELSSDKFLISHLRMTGKYFSSTNSRNTAHDYLIFKLKNDDNKLIELFYNDYRQFGTFHIKTKMNLFTTKPLLNLGKEPDEINIEELYKKIRKKSIPIKTFLLDQSYILGIGNIYANEVLFDVMIDPETKTNLIPFDKFKEIILSAKNIMDLSTKLGGSTINDYSSLDGTKGNYQTLLKVHLRKNKECFRCKNIIESKFVNQRMTYYCSNCQKEKYE
ncbi:DNA-formamidopyrimidine glycosylase [Mycoplasmopsis maculosa]|uniref:DNA-formamidopyrimidine glycosylase n=1 Tax=Mycoplasmopsis maculosa TaxID=114885 RepID=A0A449B3V9_9BACT|nr:bifunctional DNA-formamidopyrimidine glycosylase/DNA-(apurinic or apyrimidinic site) lyase [Mycoplasmopsis maculosa]VEU75277.1 DNA-formamidopyrimidine glycosylase [Mycoplasmopsis maculosa]